MKDLILPWYHILITQPAIGQRCLVWDIRYRRVVLAYWIADGRFEEWARGEKRRVEANRWLPEPGPPEAER